MRVARTAPFLRDLVADMRELCPEALLLNYTNPMAAVCLALGRLAGDIRYVGLCHGVQTTLDLISRYVDTPKDRVGHEVAGINHMAWFLSLYDKADGSDLYPRFKANCEKPEYFKNEKVRIEVMRHFGYFMTESTGHLSEYLPWFRSSERALKEFCDEPGFGGETAAYLKFSEMLAQKFEAVNYLDSEPRKLGARSVEYCSYIIEAHRTDRPFRLQGNVRNDGYIDNLPSGCCVEVPVYVDGNGLHPARVGALPSGCAALNLTNVNVQTLAAEAALAGDPDLLAQAVALDPLASTKCTLAEARRMTADLLAAQAKWLPQFKGRMPKPTPSIKVTAGTKGVDVPVDPALAVANRFGELANRRV
jgi:alpha-galactosidase